MTTHTFDVDARVGTIDIGSDQPGDRIDASKLVFRRTYFDTRRLRLTGAGIALTRDTEPGHAGWLLTLPGAPEMWVALDDTGAQDSAPADFLDRLNAWTRNRKLRPTLELSIQRTVHRLADPTGSTEVEIDDDRVKARRARRHTGPKKRRWREIQCRFDGRSALSGAVTDRIARSDGITSNETSPLVLGLRSSRYSTPTQPRAGDLSRKSTAGAVVHAHLDEQLSALVTHDYAARHDEPDGVHKMRVATRRLRSALSTFRPLLDPRVTDPIRDELAWLGGILGAARDAEVLRDRLLDGLPSAHSARSAPARIEAELRADHAIAHHRLVHALHSMRYFDLLDRLDAIVAAPPFTRRAGTRADKTLRKLLNRSFHRVQQLATAGPPPSADDVDPWLHQIRKAAKRLRYAAEAVQPAIGQSAAKLAASAEHLQNVLGEHQDSVVARQVLRDMDIRIRGIKGGQAAIARLHAREQSRSNITANAFAEAWLALADNDHRLWTR